MSRPRSITPAPTGGTESMRRSGRKALLVAVTVEQRAFLRAAAGAADIPMSHFVLRSALAAAEKKLGRKLPSAID